MLLIPIKWFVKIQKILEMVYYNKTSITPLIDPAQLQHRQSSRLVCACANICDYCSLEGVQYKIIEASG